MSDNIRIKSLVFEQMAPHAQQYRRSHATHLNADVLAEISDVYSNVRHALENPASFCGVTVPRISPGLTAPYLDDFVTPMVTPSAVTLPTANGDSWAGEVASFVMEVEYARPISQQPSLYYVAGFTDRPIPTDIAAIDPNTVLHINSIHEYRSYENITAAGNVSCLDLVRSVILLRNPEYLGPGNDCEQLHQLRPYDIVNTMVRLSDPMLRDAGVVVYDSRTVVTNRAVFGEYTHNDVSDWAESLIYSDISVERLKGHYPDQDHSCISTARLHQHARLLSTPPAMHQPLLRALSLIQGSQGVAITGSGSLAEFIQIDEALLSNAEVVPLQQAAAEQEYASLEGEDADALAAQRVVNSVPALMAKYGIRRAEFNFCNYVESELPELTAIEAIAGSIEDEVRVKFLEDILTRVFGPVAFGSKRACKFNGRFNLFGTSYFDLELDKVGARHYASPTFASSVFTPQLTNQAPHLDAVAEDFMRVFSDNQERTTMSDNKETTPSAEGIAGLNPWRGSSPDVRHQMFRNHAPALNDNPNLHRLPSLETKNLLNAMAQEPRPTLGEEFLKREADFMQRVANGEQLTPGEEFVVYSMAEYIEQCKMLDAIPEHELTAEQLDDRYNFDGVGEHPKYSLVDWRAAVVAHKTVSGYWEWVRGQIHDAYIHAPLPATSALLSSKHHKTKEQILSSMAQYKGSVKEIQVRPYTCPEGSADVVIQENGPDDNTYRWCVRLLLNDKSTQWVSAEWTQKECDDLAVELSRVLGLST